MKARVCVVLLLCLCIATAVQAGTYTLPVACGGSYVTNGSTEFNLNFGQSFSSIQSMTMTWSGQVVAGWYSDPVEGISGPWTGQFSARLYTEFPNISHSASTPLLGRDTYPDAEQFDLTSTFNGWGGPKPWDFLLDGQAYMRVYLIAAFHSGGGGGSLPTGTLDEGAYVTLEATPIPEPTGLLCLAMGALPVAAGLLRHRRV